MPRRGFRNLQTYSMVRLMMTRRNFPLGDYARAAEAAVALTIAAAMIALLPFRLVARAAAWGRAGEPRCDAVSAADQAALAIDRAARRLPFRLVCIQRGLALQWMLRRRALASTLHYGVRREKDRIFAHVWVSHAGRILIGEAEAGAHACVATFPAQPG